MQGWAARALKRHALVLRNDFLVVHPVAPHDEVHDHQKRGDQDTAPLDEVHPLPRGLNSQRTLCVRVACVSWSLIEKSTRNRLSILF